MSAHSFVETGLRRHGVIHDPTEGVDHRRRVLVACGAVGLLLAGSIACTRARDRSAPAASGADIRIIGSDTMVNLLQAWAEQYTHVTPAVVVQVAGGGSGVGITGLIGRTLDIAAASRDIRTAERDALSRISGTPPTEPTVALDALAIYVHR